MSQRSAFEWDGARYTTYVKEMDHEHEKLVQIMNRLFAENENGAPKAQILRSLDELGKWTQTHFAHEEVLFSKIPNYHSAEVHRRIHQTLLNDFSKHAEKYKASGDRLPNEFFLFLKVWLSTHICGIDRKYGEATKAG